MRESQSEGWVRGAYSEEGEQREEEDLEEGLHQEAKEHTPHEA